MQSPKQKGFWLVKSNYIYSPKKLPKLTDGFYTYPWKQSWIQMLYLNATRTAHMLQRFHIKGEEKWYIK